MNDEQQSAAEHGDANGENSREDSPGKSRRETIEDRFKQGLGALGAMRDAIEDTIREIKERGDLGPDRAREMVRGALDKAQEKAEEARDALDFVKQKEFDGLKAIVEDLASRMGVVETRAGVGNPDGEEDVEEDIS